MLPRRLDPVHQKPPGIGEVRTVTLRSVLSPEGAAYNSPSLP